MARKRLVALACVLLAFAARDVAAQETEAPPEQSPLPDLTPTESPKEGFWENFALYVEAAVGGGRVDRIDTSITTGATRISRNYLDLNDNETGRAKIGWTLPAGRGTFLLSFSGTKEDSFRYRSVGENNDAFDPMGIPVGTPVLQPWWDVTIDKGRIDATRTPPTWFDDGNGLIDPGELVFTTDVQLSGAATDNLVNQFQTWDLLYQRDFGGRRVSGRWNTGLRYFVYQGNVLAGAWVSELFSVGYTDGVFNNMMNVAQDTTGIGPTGMLEIHVNFFRKRLSWYAQGKMAFLILNLETETGSFYGITQPTVGEASVLLSPDTSPLNPNGLDKTVDKSGWQVGAESGIRVRLFDELYLEAGYGVESYQDTILMPVVLSISGIAAQGAVALYKTQDLVVTSWHAGFGFQF